MKDTPKTSEKSREEDSEDKQFDLMKYFPNEALKLLSILENLSKIATQIW
jgi:hypothetical protein